MKRRLSTCWSIWFLFAVGLVAGRSATAASVAEIAADLKPIEGYVVMTEGGEFIIDLDAGSGAAVGDIFAVAGQGRKIVHPVTQKVLGTLPSVKGILKVTRLQQGYSFARPLGGAAEIKRGDAIRRYAMLPAIFWDYTGRGRALFGRLLEQLPDLKWMDYERAQQERPSEAEATKITADALTFIHNENQLQVRDPEFTILRTYRLDAGAPAGAEAAPALTPPPAPPPAPVARNRAEGAAAAGVVAPEFKTVQTVATFPDAVVMADFLRGDGRLWVAATDSLKIDILSYDDSLKLVLTDRPEYPAKILSLKWWCPESSAAPYLAATTWSDNRINGMIYRFENERLVVQKANIPRILGTFDLDGDGSPETLLGQEFVGETFFGRRIKVLQLTGGDIRQEPFKMELANNFTVLGSIIADVKGDGKLENAFVRNGILFVHSGKNRLYKSAKEMGGSLSFLTYEVNPGFQDPRPTTVEIELSPLAVDTNADGLKELVVVSSERSMLGSLGVAPGVMKTWLTVFKYETGRFTTGRLGEEMELPMQGMTLEGDRLLMVATEPGDLLEKAVRSFMLRYVLSR